jgi:hypothetical protein
VRNRLKIKELSFLERKNVRMSAQECEKKWDNKGVTSRGNVPVWRYDHKGRLAAIEKEIKKSARLHGDKHTET